MFTDSDYDTEYKYQVLVSQTLESRFSLTGYVKREKMSKLLFL